MKNLLYVMRQIQLLFADVQGIIKKGEAFIPFANRHLRRLAKVNEGMVVFMQKRIHEN